MNNGRYLGDQSDDIKKDLIVGISHWVERAIEHKNQRLTIALADSIVLKYNDLDKKLLALSHLN